MTSPHHEHDDHAGHNHGDDHAGHGHAAEHPGHGDDHAGHNHGDDHADEHRGHDHSGHGHDDHAGHGHAGHDHAAELREAGRRSLLIAFFLISGFMVAEIVGGIMSGSLALLADAGHMLTDAGAIGLALLALWISAKPETINRTFGYHRSEVLAALINALSLWLIAGWIVWEAVEGRLLNPESIEIEGGLMLIIGAVGLGVNIVAALVLHAGSKHSLNVDGAFKHVLADMLGSVAVVLSGVIVITTGWELIDPILSLGIALLIVLSSWRLIWKTLNVLLGGVPQHIDLYALCDALEAVEGVTLIHDVHAWTITSNYDLLTAHVLVDPSYHGDRDELLTQLRQIAAESYGLHHVTLQIFRAAGQCVENHHVGHLAARSAAG